jgi:hypothetical protein
MFLPLRPDDKPRKLSQTLSSSRILFPCDISFGLWRMDDSDEWKAVGTEARNSATGRQQLLHQAPSGSGS